MSIRSALLVLLVALAAWLVTVARSWDGWTGTCHATGTVAALADGVLHGEAPGHERDAMLGTVITPPFPLAVAALRGTGVSWHAALRWASLLAALALLVAVLAATVACGASASGVCVALALVLAMLPFKTATLAGRPDLIAAALSIGALAAWSADREQRGWLTAALAALAWLTKLSAVTTPLAVVLWALAQGQGVPAVRFLFKFALLVGLGVVATLPFHGAAWYASALGTLITAAPGTWSLLRGPAELLRHLGAYAELAAAAALALACLASREMRGRPVRAFALASLLVALAVMANRGSEHNHLVELGAVAAVCAGVWCERVGARAAALPAALVLLVVFASSWRDFKAFAAETSAPASDRGAVLAAVRADSGAVFSEDPLLVLAAGRRAPVADPGALRSLVHAGDRRARAVVDALARGRWSLVVLDLDLERGATWYRDLDLGPEAVAALRSRYEKAGELDGRTLYRPRPLAPPVPFVPAAAAAPPSAPPAPDAVGPGGSRGQARPAFVR